MSAFEQVIADGGVVLFPSDTVYGLACSPDDAGAIARLYQLKGRPPEKASAVMFFELEAALRALPELGPRTRVAMRRLMPGSVTVLIPNPSHRFPLACAADPDTLGVRVIDVPALAGVRVPVMQSSANPSGGADARSLSEVAPAMRAGADLVIDGGELPGVASTVIDLRGYERGEWSIVRHGAVPYELVEAALDQERGFDPETYADIVAEIPGYEELQDRIVLAAASYPGAGLALELGTGTGETARRLLERMPGLKLVGIDESTKMLAAAAEVLPAERVTLIASRLQDALPAGRFDLVVSALAVHHLDDHEKADLFARLRVSLAPGGRFVLGDVVVPDDPADAVTPLTPGYDKPSSVLAQCRLLEQAGFGPVEVVWAQGDLAVIVADPRGDHYARR